MENGPDTEDADLMFMSIPNAMLKRIHMDATVEIARRDKDLLSGLEKAASSLTMGPTTQVCTSFLYHNVPLRPQISAR